MFSRDVSPPQDTSVLSPGLHIGLILTLAFIIFKKSSSRLFEHHPCLYILTFGTVISKISNKLVVSSSDVFSFFLSFLADLQILSRSGLAEMSGAYSGSEQENH